MYFDFTFSKVINELSVYSKKKVIQIYSLSRNWYTFVLVCMQYLEYMYKELCTIYFLLRFGLVNAINDYLRLKIRIVCVGNYQPSMFIN